MIGISLVIRELYEECKLICGDLQFMVCHHSVGHKFLATNLILDLIITFAYNPRKSLIWLCITIGSI